MSDRSSAGPLVRPPQLHPGRADAGYTPAVTRAFAAAALLCAACRAPSPEPATPPAPVAPVAPVASTPTTASPEPAPTPEPAPFAWRHTFVSDPDAGTFAVVTPGTRLFQRPGGPGVVVDEWHPRVVKVLGQEGDLLEVALDWPDDPGVRHCLLAPFAEVGLRVFVREDALADVVAESLNIETGYNAGIVVAPGVLAYISSDGARPVWTLAARSRGSSRAMTMTGDHLRIQTHTAPSALAKTYTPVRVDSLRPKLDAPAPFSIAMDERAIAQLDYGEADTRLLGSLYAQSPDDPDRVVFGTSCLQVAGRVNRALESNGAGGAGCGRGPFAWEDRWQIPAGTPLTWRTGGPAGELFRELTLGQAPTRRGRRSCFAPSFGCGSYPDLAVCVPTAAVVHLPASGRPSFMSGDLDDAGAAR